jgi:hypothetical protein
MTKLYLGVLDEPRRKVFEKLSVFTQLGGVLAGGTAMALQLNHRRSDDFDIFFPSLITNELRRRLISITEKPINIRLDNSRQLTLSDRNGIKVTLVIHEFAPLYPVIKTDSLPLFHLADLASNKAYTVGKRGVWRDYVDLFYLLKFKLISLEQILKEAEKRFGDQFSAKLFLEQLVYNKDIFDFQIDYIGKKYTPEEVMLFLEKTEKDYLKKNVLI